MTAISDRGISDQGLSEPWKITLLMTALVLGWVSGMYWKTVWSMVSIWERSDTFAHGFVVLPIALWLIWRKRESAWGESPTPSRAALLLLSILGVFWLVGELAAAKVLAQLALVSLLIFSVPALLGWRVARKFAFPLGFLLFAVPMGEFMIPQLMDWTAYFTVAGLRLSGVPVYQDGLSFVIPSGNWSVVEACSGIRYLMASLMVGTLFAYLNFQSLHRRLAFVAVSIVVPVVANWLRAYLIVMLGHLSGNELATGADHLIYGWVFFGLVIVSMFLVGSRWSEPEAAAPARLPSGGSLGRPVAGRLDWTRAALVALVATWPVLVLNAASQLPHAQRPLPDQSLGPLAIPGWQAADGSAPTWQPAFKDASYSWQQIFRSDGRVVGVYVGYYRNQDQDRKMISSTNTLVRNDDKDWMPAKTGRREIQLQEKSLVVNGAELKARGDQAAGPRLLVWQWYWIAGRVTASAHWAKAYTAWSRLFEQGDDSAVCILYAPADQPGGGEAALEAFVRSASPVLTRRLDDIGSRH